MDGNQVFQWQMQELTNKILPTLSTNEAPTPEDQQAMDMQNLILRQSR